MHARSRTLSTPQDLQAAESVMRDFAARTGIGTPEGRRRRYLWTDAFAVCNFLSLHLATGASEDLAAARALVDDVHEGLGRHRDDDPRRGWISGLGESQGRQHPTRGGLRIGKPLPERRAGEPHDERLEWDRDGQYFHYLTRWMHALARMHHTTHDERYLQWAFELAERAHAAFTWVHPRDRRRRMYWKMSIALDRPLVPSMGHHDPLDGFLTYLELQAATPAAARPGYMRMLAETREMVLAADQATHDPLGIGGLLVGAHALAQLVARGAPAEGVTVASLLRAAALGVATVQHHLRLPAEQRLAFRELGLAIGLRAAADLDDLLTQRRETLGDAASRSLATQLRRSEPLGRAIVQYWLDPEHQASTNWLAHRDINDVMLATSLAPDGYLTV